MKIKKFGSLICLIIVVSVFIPVISIAFARKPDRGPLEKIVYIHYKKGYGKPPGTPGVGPDKDDGDEDEGYYKLLGAKWKETPVDYVIDPDNQDGLTEEFIVSTITASVNEWDEHTSIDLFGSYIVDDDSSWDDDAPDGRNELVFGDYPQDGVIAVCIVWGYFRGASGKGVIVEFDIMFDTDYTWGDAGETSETTLGDTDVMDLQNIATHELGHGVGLADLYDDAASEETMYGYSTWGETKKRTLYFGDQAGIQELYG